MRFKYNRMCKCINEENNIKYLHYNLINKIILYLPSFFTTVASCLGTVNLSIASCVFDVVWSSSLRRNICNWSVRYDSFIIHVSQSFTWSSESFSNNCLRNFWFANVASFRRSSNSLTLESLRVFDTGLSVARIRLSIVPWGFLRNSIS